MKLTRSRIVEQARVHHVLCAFSSLHYPDSGSTWSGDSDEGGYSYHNGCGDSYRLRWTRGGLIALAFDHESQRSQYHLDEEERTPLRWLVALPEALQPVALATAREMESLVTAALWAEGETATLSDPLSADGPAHGLERLRGYGFSAEAAVLGDAITDNWRTLASLDEDQAALAIRLARAAPTTLSAVDEEILLRRPSVARPAAIRLSSAEEAARLLAQLGISWTVPVARIEAGPAAELKAREQRAAAAIGPLQVRLFEAVRAGDVHAVRVLLVEGANPTARTVENQWEYTPAGDTPLIQACKAERLDVALILAEVGGDLDARNSFGQSALLWAARQSWPRLARALVSRGADVQLATDDGETPLHAAARAADDDVAGLLLEAGARKDARAHDGRTPADFARAAGHEARARLLTP